MDATTFWSAASAIATAVAAIAAVVACSGIFYAARQLRFAAWLRAQEIFIDKEFTGARETVLKRFGKASIDWTPSDDEKAKVVCRRMDELCHLAPFLREKDLLETWDDPLGKSWSVLATRVRAERDLVGWEKKWGAFEVFGMKALERLGLPQTPAASPAQEREGQMLSDEALGGMMGESADERHNPISAATRDEKPPVWDMSQERVFLETLLNQRFNFFLVFFSLVLAGAVNVKDQRHLQLILTLGAIVTALFASVLARSQEKLDIILADLFTDPTHPATIVNRRAKQGGSRRRLIGVWIPRFCAGILLLAALLAWLAVLHVAPLARQANGVLWRHPTISATLA